MTPIDYRNATWADLQERLHGDRLRVLDAWRMFGPGTTRDVAARAAIDILTFRPRSTELYQLGCLRLLDGEGHEGRYQARTAGDVAAEFELRCKAARDQQDQFALGV